MSNVEGFGSITWWGFSPALDLSAFARRGMKKPEEAADKDTSSACEHILVVGCGDLRHILMTLAHAREHSSKKLQFYVVESSLEILARHMLFLALLHEPQQKLGLQEKTELFLELYGNTLVRSHTAEYLREKATDLIKMVTDLDYLSEKTPLLDISQLKFRERDMLEGIFKFWRLSEPNTFDIQRHWEGRLRHHLGVRYDSRTGVFDWDYHMKLHDIAPVVSSHEYQRWRESGVAFTLREDAPYDQSNRTLASGLILKQGGERVARRGYWGDIVNSPFISLGTESENKGLFKTANDKHIKSSAHVSEWNVQSLIQQLCTGRKEVQRKRGQRSLLPPTIEEEEEEEEEKEEEREEEEGGVREEKVACDGVLQEHPDTPQGPLYNANHRIVFLPLNCVPELGKKAKFKELFSTAYFSNSMVHHLTSGVEKTFTPDCSLVLETARFMLELKKEQQLEYVRRVTEMAKTIGYTVPLHSSPPEDSIYIAFSHS